MVSSKRPKINSKIKKLNKDKIPILAKSKIEKKGVIGQGVAGVVNKYKVSENNFGKKKKYLVAGKDFRYLNPTSKKERLITTQKIWFKLFEAGLPVPKFSKIDLRKSSLTYLTIFREFVKNKGKLVDCRNDKGEFILPKDFNFKRDKKLIKGIAKDLVMLGHLGITTKYLDFWNFYKMKSGGYNRILVDFNQLYFAPSPMEAKTHISFYLNSEIGMALKKQGQEVLDYYTKWFNYYYFEVNKLPKFNR